MNRFDNIDCMLGMKDYPDEYFDLAVVDPPYNIKKAKWDKINNYIEWLGSILLEIQRVLKDNGSMYLFHNDFLQMVKIQNFISQETEYVFKQLIIWNKKFDGYWNQLNAIIDSEELRNYSKQAEYILFYTFQDETGLTTVKLDLNNFTSLRGYFRDYQLDTKLTKKQIIDLIGQKADHCFRWDSSQWDLPTEETYNELLKLPQQNGFLRREYESLRREYESLREEYESLRYTFNNQKTHHSIWNYEIESCEWHPTMKPKELMKNIIRHSSNENDKILDPFAGTAIVYDVCLELNREYTGFEKDENYYSKAQERLSQLKLAI